jgi:hypothetical protein
MTVASPFAKGEASRRPLARASGSASEAPQNLQNCAAPSATPRQREQTRPGSATGFGFTSTTRITGIGARGAIGVGGPTGDVAGEASSVVPQDVQ